MKTLKEKIEVMQAALEGKAIEIKECVGLAWETLLKHPNAMTFNWDHYDYRIKPEPRRFWVNWYSCSGYGLIYQSRDAADAGDPDGTRTSCFEVQEIL